MEIIHIETKEETYESVDLIVTAKLDDEEIKTPAKAFQVEFNDGQRCGHEYDCCGCWHTNVWTHTLAHVVDDLYSIEIHRYRNL